MKRWSIAARLTWSLTAATAFLWLVAIAVSLFQVRHEIDEVFDSAMQEMAQRLTPLVVRSLHYQGGDDYESELAREHFLATQPHEEYLVYWVRDEEGQVLLHSHDAGPIAATAPLVPGFAYQADQRVYTERAGSLPLFVQVGEPEEHRVEAVWSAMLPFLVAPLGLLPIMVFSMWLIIRRVLRPLGEVRQELAARDGTNLAVLQIDGLPRELQVIVAAVNRLLGRLRSALEAERTLAASSAHELRTPIAAARAQAQLLAEGLAPGPDRDRATLVTDLLARLGRLTEKLLQLTRAESSSLAADEEVDVGRLVMALVEDYRRHPDYGPRITAHLDGNRRVRWRTDGDALGIAVQNLIENAFTHGGAEVRVEVVVEPTGPIRVRDDGPGVPPEQLPGLIQRFRRGENGSKTGTGLGLAIVDTIMTKLGGRLELRSRADGKESGFEAILYPPTATIGNSVDRA